MATDTITADLPPMQNFKAQADEIIYDKYGIKVEHFNSPTYESIFYKVSQSGNHAGTIYGFPVLKGAWCTGMLKQRTLTKIRNRGDYTYIGYADDEPNPKRQKILDEYKSGNGPSNKVYPLVDHKITEAQAYKWCEDNDLLSPTYKDHSRGGCWFCHNQRLRDLRLLYYNYPEYFDLLLKWDTDSPTTFKPDGTTVHDYARLFELENEGLISADEIHKIKKVKELNE